MLSEVLVMENKEIDFRNDDIKELYKSYIEIVSLIEELNKNIKELPSKEVI